MTGKVRSRKQKKILLALIKHLHVLEKKNVFSLKIFFHMKNFSTERNKIEIPYEPFLLTVYI